jgi:lipoprotein-anchoring transpeptidase ErfK/SrfK
MTIQSPPSPSSTLVVDVTRQQVDLLGALDEVLASYPVSTSKFGLGFEEGSFKTPTGRFRISEKIGAGEPPWMSFKSRIPTGSIAVPGGSEDHILSRILWLEGMDAENSNTLKRTIYFHGTNQEELIGTPVSHGCIRLRNRDMIELFDLVKVGDPLEIRA